MTEYVIVESISKVFQVKSNKILAVDNISFTVNKPEFISILGPNGAGKTTLLNIIAVILPPTSGEVFIKGLNAWKNPWKAKKFIGFVPQEHGINENLTVIENLYYACELYNIPKINARKIIRELIELFDLDEHKNKLASKLSGGFKRRLSIAMSLVHNPEILILDEPTTGLDPGMRRELIEFLKHMISRGRVILMSTHIAGEAEYSDRVMIMHRGKLVADDNPEDLKKKTIGLKTIIEIDIFPISKIDEVIKSLSRKWFASKKRSNVRVIVNSFEKEIADVLDLIRSCNVKVLEVRARQPTLDDVFLKLTGYELGEE